MLTRSADDTHKLLYPLFELMIRNLAERETAFTSNAFLVEGDRRVLVDTGANFDVVSAIEGSVDDLDDVVVTHTHPDHVGNIEAVAAAYDIDVWGYDETHEAIDAGLADGDELALGDHTYTAVHTPGHKDDHLCLYAENPGILFAGDLVFANGGFGRTDLPEGDRATLIESIGRIEKLVDPSLRALHTGHGPSVTDDPYEHVALAGWMARTH